MLLIIWKTDDCILTQRIEKKTLIYIDAEILNEYCPTRANNEWKNHDQVRCIPGTQLINIRILLIELTILITD